MAETFQPFEKKKKKKLVIEVYIFMKDKMTGCVDIILGAFLRKLQKKLRLKSKIFERSKEI